MRTRLEVLLALALLALLVLDYRHQIDNAKHLLVVLAR